MPLPSILQKPLWSALVFLGLFLGSIGVLHQQRLAQVPPDVWLDVSVRSDHPAPIQVFVDTGAGFNEQESSARMVAAGADFVPITLPLGRKAIRALRLDPGSSGGKLELKDLRLRNQDGSWKQSLPASSARALQQISELRVQGEVLALAIPAGANDPSMEISLPSGIDLRGSAKTRRLGSWLVLTSVFGVAAWGLWFAERKRRLPWRDNRAAPLAAPTRLLGFAAISAILGGLLHLVCPGSALLLGVLSFSLIGLVGSCRCFRLPTEAMKELLQRHPISSVAATALLSCLMAMAPVFFQGRSLLSVDGDIRLVYSDSPTVPGAQAQPYVSSRGADTGAMFWQHLPYTELEHRALFSGEAVPWWNRQSSCGIPLLGQGQAMWGDPLHWPFVLLGAEAWTLDLKFALYRFLFAFGVGLSVLLGGGRLFAACLACMGASVVGYFNFRLNHPAIFSICVSPWVLVGWMVLATARDLRGRLGGAALLVLASLSLLLSGTVKEAYVLFLAMHACGALAALTRPGSLRTRAEILMLGGAATLAGLMLASPVLLSLASALPQSFTMSNEPRIYLLSRSAIPCLLDDLLWRNLLEDRLGMFPTLNLILGSGLLAALLSPALLVKNRLAGALALGFVTALITSHDFVPVEWLMAIPGLGKLHHIHNLFTCFCVVSGSVLAGLGFSELMEAYREGGKRFAIKAGLVLASLNALLWYYLQANRPLWRSWGSLAAWKTEWTSQQAFYTYLVAALGVIALCLALIALLRRLPWLAAPALISVAAALFVLTERHALSTSGDLFHAVIGTRTPLTTGSEALSWLQAQAAKEPMRVVGEGDNLIGNIHALYGLEGINGPDALIPRHYRELLEAAGLVAGDEWRVSPDSATLARVLPFLRFLNVRYLVALPATPMKVAGTQPALLADLQIREVEQVWPRAFFTNRILGYAEPKQLLGLLQDRGEQAFAALPETEAQALRRALPPDTVPTSTAARDYHLGTNSTTFQADCAGPGLVVLQEGWQANDFRAYVDGVETDIMRANHAFKAVRIASKGSHRVEFVFRPRFATLGWGLALLGGTFLCVCLYAGLGGPGLIRKRTEVLL